MEAINLKISKVGGLTRAKLMRDLAATLGLRRDDRGHLGRRPRDRGRLATSRRARRPETLFTVSFMNDWTNEHVAGYQPRSQDGVGAAPTGPGLGVEVDVEALGAPLFSVAA